QSGLLGDMYITILPGTEQAPAAQAGDVLSGTEPIGLADLSHDAQDLLRKLNGIVDKVNKDFLTDETLISLRATLLNLRDLTGRLQTTSGDLNKILGGIKRGQGTVGKLVKDDEVYENLRALSYNLRKGGVLFYKDRYEADRAKGAQKQDAQAAESKKKQQENAMIPKSRFLTR
ncbi:MAG: hypothetical protein JO317_04345, partial [Verrucomicrobiae bacterium]|nr:hypothetical protein [Verrucomicrobiae bacterium]